jgi:antitoxin YefM
MRLFQNFSFWDSFLEISYGKEETMYAAYRMRADEITENFLKGIKDIYQDKEIEIIVQEVEDETAYLLKSEANRRYLLQAIEDVRNGVPGHTMTFEELEKTGI